jgi:hypothetical protein
MEASEINAIRSSCHAIKLHLTLAEKSAGNGRCMMAA